MKKYFETLSQSIFKTLQTDEHLTLDIAGDDTQFVRLNAAKIRQSGVVENYFLSFNLVMGNDPKQLKRGSGQITLCLDLALDQETLLKTIARFRKELPGLPVDPYAEIPKNESASSVSEVKGKLIARDAIPEALLSVCNGVDIAGIYAAGSVVRGIANSAGLFHWFSTETFSFDYSLYTEGQKALKGGYGGTEWNQDIYQNKIRSSLEKLERLKIPSRKIGRGDYRVYLAPAAFEDLVNMLNWGGVSEMAIRKNQSALRFLRTGEKKLSSLFTLTEDFLGGEVPRFNGEGHLAPVTQTLIDKGMLKAAQVSARTALEFGIPSNGASESEGMKSPIVKTGTLKESDILSQLGTGLYLSNLHYLNWSDMVNGRITGMTRYACFWVENGKMICPIENLRFDETIFDVFGSSLEALTEFDEYSPSTGTYGNEKSVESAFPARFYQKCIFRFKQDHQQRFFSTPA